MQQLDFFEDVLLKNPNTELAKKINMNESEIDRLENEVREEVVKSLLTSSPRAIELRKIITYQDITNFLESIGDLLMDIITYPIEKKVFDLPDFEDFRAKLKEMLIFSKKMVNDAIFSFYYEDSDIAYRTIIEDNILDGLFREISENTLLYFQDTPLSEQELTNIIHITNSAFIIEQIGDIATYIAEAAIYMIKGTDIRHKFSNYDVINETNGNY
jgi:phosphate transport system protein